MVIANLFKNISHSIECTKLEIGGKENSNTIRIVKIQVIPSGILTDMVKESLNPRVYKECTKGMDEEGIPMTVDPRKNYPFFQESGRSGDPHCIAEDGKDCTACM